MKIVTRKKKLYICTYFFKHTSAYLEYFKCINLRALYLYDHSYEELRFYTINDDRPTIYH